MSGYIGVQKSEHKEQVRTIFLPDKAKMGCALDDMYADVLYSTVTF